MRRPVAKRRDGRLATRRGASGPGAPAIDVVPDKCEIADVPCEHMRERRRIAEIKIWAVDPFVSEGDFPKNGVQATVNAEHVR